MWRNKFAEDIFYLKYALHAHDTWDAMVARLIADVVGKQGDEPALMHKDEMQYLSHAMNQMWFVPGGRYLYYAGRPMHAWNNCFLLKAEHDDREEWARIMHNSTSCLMLGGGIGIDYSVLRGEGAPLSKTGGKSSGPIPLMEAVNSLGTNVMQGGSRRSAIYASLAESHPDIYKFLVAKDWHRMDIPGTSSTVWDAKVADPNYRAPLDMTNISVNYDEQLVERSVAENLDPRSVWMINCYQAMKTGEPGFSFNMYEKKMRTLRNACTEVDSDKNNDVCNLGSVNMGQGISKAEYADVCRIGAKFLYAGSMRSTLPYEDVADVRREYMRQGEGLMGMHEWLLRRGEQYEVTPELRGWLEDYKQGSEAGANEMADRHSLPRPVAYRAIAPTGSIGILAGTTTGIEPLFAVAYLRRYLVDATTWESRYVVDSTAETLIKETDTNPDDIDTAYKLALDPERRIKFQADVQDFVDMSISSTINLPAWGSATNNPGRVESFARTLLKYAPRLRGFTCYPDGARGGQPLTEVGYKEAITHKDVILKETDICDITGKGGSCGA